MRFDIHRLSKLAAGTVMVVASTSGAPASQAEYAVHWDTSDGGPSTAAEVVRLLDLGRARADTFEVRYYDAPTPASAPDSARTIFRERSRNGGAYELVVKYRRSTPLTGAWTCPLGRRSHRSAQVDIAFGPGSAVTRTYSYACEVAADSFPSSLHASPRPCTLTFTRLTTKGHKVETWPLPMGHQLVELSRVGKDSDKELAKFRELAEQLIAAGARPISVSKTELEGACR